MKLTIEPTGTIEDVNGIPARIWKGKTEAGSDVMLWVSVVRVHKDAPDVEAFDRALREVKADRQLVSFDIRLVL